MAEPDRWRLHLAPVPPPEPPRRYRTLADVPARCPREGCGGMLKGWPDGAVCVACGRVVYVVHALERHLRAREVRG